tara:strand:- start:1093 stop:2211 length:1119 start_codon:yes stop_codon:yes gene_type:complete
MKKKINILIIGAGRIAEQHAYAYKNQNLFYTNMPFEINLYYLVDKNFKILNKVKKKFNFNYSSISWKKALNDEAIDIVDICTPNNSHYEIIKYAAKKKKFIYCEKPISNTLNESKKIKNLVNRNRVGSFIGYNYLHIPLVKRAKKIISSGELGKINYFRSVFNQDFFSDPNKIFSWRFSKLEGGSGVLQDLASHTIAFALYFFEDITEVVSYMDTLIKKRKFKNNLIKVQNFDNLKVLMKFKHGFSGLIESSRVFTGKKWDLSFEIQGENGSIYFNNENMNEMLLYKKNSKINKSGFIKLYPNVKDNYQKYFNPLDGFNLGFNDQKLIEINQMLESYNNKTKSDFDINFAHKISKVTDAIEKSYYMKSWKKV